MKPILTITLMFISTILCAQTIDWQNAPLNPAAIYYTLNHYNLNGPIKEVNSISIEKRIFNLTFNEDGYLLKKLVSQPAETSKVLYEFEYQDKGILKSTKMSYVDSDNKITMTYEYLIFYNEKGLVSEKVALPNKSKTLYNYDEKGKLISLRYINEEGKDSGGIDYTYNNDGQIILETEKKFNGKFDFKFEYSKETDGQFKINVFTYMDDVLKVREHPFPVSTFIRQITLTNYKNPEDYYFDDVGHEGFKQDYIKVSKDQFNNMRETYSYMLQKNTNTVDLTYYNSIVSVITEPLSDNNCISGNCTDGFGVLKTSTSTITGFFASGKANGYGKEVYDDGSGHYEGKFGSGVRSGFGLYYWNSTQQYYIGEWKNGKQHGYGYYKKGSEIFQAGYYENGKQVRNMLTQNFINKKAVGNCIGNCYDGFGFYQFPNNDKYVGFFKNGKKDYVGAYTWATGDAYIGGLLLGSLSGQAMLFYKSTGTTYYGNISNGIRQGMGAYFNKSGDIESKGFWDNGVLKRAL